jgi:hypothetical protein
VLCSPFLFNLAYGNALVSLQRTSLAQKAHWGIRHMHEAVSPCEHLLTLHGASASEYGPNFGQEAAALAAAEMRGLQEHCVGTLVGPRTGQRTKMKSAQ